MTDFASRRASFRKLHESGCFVMPNPWDPGSARYLVRLGFPAIATTSAGFAFSRGLPDLVSAVWRDRMLTHIADIVAAVELPVNADFGSAFADDPRGVAANARLCAETGVAGLSIEDATGDRANPLYDLLLSTERIRAARAALDASGSDVLLTARAECYLTGHDDPFNESMRRLTSYAEAGADVLYAPGITSPAEIKTMVAALTPRPVNILVSRNTGVTVADLAALGVRRISVGSALARAAWTGFMRAADGLANGGSFAGFDGVASFAEINNLFVR
jgi:2-methylisocitrate lyase-like PEP mutase family enzyme